MQSAPFLFSDFFFMWWNFQSFCKKYFDKRLFCHKFDVFFWQFVANIFKFICETTYLPKIERKSLKVLHNCLQHERVFLLSYFEHCQILAKYSLWMIDHHSSKHHKIENKKTLLVLCICNRLLNPIVAMREFNSPQFWQMPIIVFFFFFLGY
jgi:hypothetical protein